MLFEVTSVWSGEGYRGKVKFSDSFALDFFALPPWGPGGDFTPESCFIASLSMCYEMFLIGMLKRMRIEPSSIEVKVTGEIENESDIKPGKAFDRIEIIPRIKVKEAEKDKALRAAKLAEEYCFITNSIKVPITLSPEIIT
ncbi:MAG: OsmC family protein [Candidatus Freyarchaeota archaeon]